MLSRRRFIAFAAGSTALVQAPVRAQSKSAPTINVKDLGAFGNGKLPDKSQIQQAIQRASETSGATIYFPPGEYYLGAADESLLVEAKGLRNVRFVGDRATLTCRSVNGSSTMLQLTACTNVTVEGLTFRDHGLKREINWLGAAAIRVSNDGKRGCERVQIRNCTFDSVLTAFVCRKSDDDKTGRIRSRGIELTNLTVTRSYYGLSFQDNGDDLVARGIRCNDVKRSYFPFGTSNHDVELDTRNNATGFTDVLIKCYHGDTVGIKVRVTCRGKRGGDAILALDHQHEYGRGTIRNINAELDIDDVDCKLDTVVLIRAFDYPQTKVEKTTNNRWDDIALDGDVRICDKTHLIEIDSVNPKPGALRIGPRLAKNPRLPRSFPGFNVTGV